MKLGVAGTGKIVTEALEVLRMVEEIRCTAIFARPHSREKGAALAERHGIPEVYTDYEEMLRRADIDTVYIGLVNSAHFAFAKTALLHLKNVILEKPFTVTYEEARELAELSKEKGCFLFEAITVLHNDLLERMRESLPKLGRIRMALANFSQYSSRYDRYLEGFVDPSFAPECYGGALRDLNVYNLHYMAGMFGAPLAVRYFPNRGFNGIDTSGTMVLSYDGFSAVCTGAKDSDSPCFVSVQGEKGYMRLEGKPNAPTGLTVVTVEEGGKPKPDASGAMARPTVTEVFAPKVPEHRMLREFRDFARIADTEDREAAERYLEETLTVMRILGTQT